MPRAHERGRAVGWKLAALVLAYLLWLAVIEEPQAIRQLEVPVRFEHLDPSLALVRDRPDSVVVRVQAPDPIAKELQPPDVEAIVDLAGQGVGSHLVRLATDSRSILTRKVGVKVIEVFPPALEVKLEPRRTSLVATYVRMQGPKIDTP